MPDTPRFSAGRNIAMKVPPHQFDATVAFYRDVIGLKRIDSLAPDVVFEFGSIRLWIDRIPAMSQAELWLEVVTSDLPAAEQYLDSHGVTRCDEIERLPPGFQGFWVQNPAAIVHLVCRE